MLQKDETTLSAIEAAEDLFQRQLADGVSERISVDQIQNQMSALVDRIMGEAGFYAPILASVAIKQSAGDAGEAVEILRAHRQTIERKYETETVDTEGMEIRRRISSAFREIPGGQILGPTHDYTQRLLDDAIARETQADADETADSFEAASEPLPAEETHPKRYTRVVDLLKEQGMVAPVNDEEDRSVVDALKIPLQFPAPRSAALQTLARSDTGAIMAIGYSAMRGQGGDHPTIGELRVGYVELVVRDQRKRKRSIGRIRVTESVNISKIKTRKRDPVPYMSLGYGLCFGQNETKAICMGIVDRSNRIPGDGAPAVSQEFSLYHLDGPDAKGYVHSLKIPSHTEMATELQDLRSAIKRSEEAKRRRSQQAAPQTDLV